MAMLLTVQVFFVMAALALVAVMIRPSWLATLLLGQAAHGGFDTGVVDRSKYEKRLRWTALAMLVFVTLGWMVWSVLLLFLYAIAGGA